MPLRLLRRWSRVPAALLAFALGSAADVTVGRIDVTPSAGSFDEKPQARVVGERAGSGVFASSGNRGDWGIATGVTEANPKGQALLLVDGVVIPSLNELLPQNKRGVVGVGGRLTTGTGGTLNGGPWVAAFTAVGDGAEANYDFAFAYFPFADGWLGGHVAADGMKVLAQGRLPADTDVRRFAGGTFDGEVLLHIPGVDSVEDGMLFTTAAGNGDDTTAVGPLPEGDGWHIRVADESHNYRAEQAVPFSFVFVPYDCDALVGGRVVRDGTVVRGVGEFGVTHAGPGRYEVFIPGKTDADGVLLLCVTMMNKDGVEDNALAWAYDPSACGGKGGFVVESYDQPGFNQQDVEFCFALFEYETPPTPPSAPVTELRPDATWEETVMKACEAAAAGGSASQAEPWISPLLRKGTAPVRASVALRGSERLWLVADPVDGNEGDIAAWGDPVFVMKDGSRQGLAGLDPLYHRVASGALVAGPVTIANKPFASGMVAHAYGLLAYTVPANAERFEAYVGLAAAATEKASVRFRISGRPHARGSWQDEVWPGLRRAFPAESARLAKDVGQGGRVETFDPGRDRGRVEAGLRAMEVTLGGLAARLPVSDASPAALLCRYGAAARLLVQVAAASDRLWVRTPTLSQVMDYPEPVFAALRTRLQAIARDRPALAPDVEDRLALLLQIEARRRDMLGEIAAGKEPGTEKTSELDDAALQVAEWADRVLGWTTYGGDNQRSWVCREPFELPRRQLWVHRPRLPPRPAWPPPRTDNPAVQHQLSPTLTYDRAFHPVAADGSVVFGSSSEDAVICLDAELGRERWRFVTGAPVRLAPTIARGRVYAGSDDGRLYCLDLASGAEVWHYRADGGVDKRLCGNGRIVSQWPVRCGICVDAGVVYAAAGVFPKLGTVLFAVDAQTGRELWRRPVPWTPQGFMLLSPERIFVPTGRTPFRVCSRADGAPTAALGSSNSWGKDLPGGTLALVVNERILTGPDEGGEFHLFDTESSECLMRTNGLRVIVDGLATYVLQKDKLVAQKRDPFVRRGRSKRLWSAPIGPAYCMLKAGDRLLLGGDGEVSVFDADSGEREGRVAVDGGRVEGLVWHDGRLIASMADGTLVCFGPEADGSAAADRGGQVSAAPLTLAAPVPERAAALARLSPPGKGYALVMDDPVLGAAVAEASGLRVVIGLRAGEEVVQWRQRLSAAGLYGARVAVHHVKTKALPYRPYTFNLVALPQGGGDTPAAEWPRVLRPNGGLLAVSGDTTPTAEAAGVPGASVAAVTEAGFAYGFRRGGLPGGGSWTHGYADAGNTACSGGAMPFGEFELLWFGRPGPRHMYQRHIKGAAPVCRDGTVFVPGKGYLAAVDMYNGAVLWEKHLHGLGRMAMLKDCGSMVAAGRGVYAAVDGICSAFDGRSGAPLSQYPVSRYAEAGLHWGYIAAAGDLLLGSATRPNAEFDPASKEDYQSVWYHHKPAVTSLSLFALDRETGSPIWRYTPADGVFANPTITLLGDRVAFVESRNGDTRVDEDGKVPLADLFKGGPMLTALRLGDGQPAWSVPIELGAFHHAIYMSGSEGVLVLTGSRHDTVEGKKLIQYQLVGIDAADGRELWRNDNTPSRGHILDGGHGEQTQHPAIVGGVIYGPGFARELRTGEPAEGWVWQKSPQCATLSTSLNCAFSRQSGNPTAAAFASGKSVRLTSVTRPGCWINTLPAGGVVLIPEASSGCTCGYSVQASLALYPLGPGE